jgi:hypothetical protein
MGLNSHDADGLRDTCIIDQNVHGAKILDYLLRHTFALIFFCYVAHVTPMHVSDGSGNPLRLLPLKVQERYGSPMFRKKLRSSQSDALLCCGT